MNEKKYLLIHKTEWARLKKHPQEHDRPVTNRGDYIKSLNEQSQEWMKNWPDSVQGHISKLEKQNKAEQQKLLESVKQFTLNKKLDKNFECVKKARELLFEDSCYGRQLLSAFLESKTLEERDEQIKFQNKIKNQADMLRKNEPIATSLQNENEMEKNEIKKKEYQKRKAFENSHVNKTMFDMQKKCKLLEKRRAKLDHCDEELMRKLIEKEKIIMMERAKLNKESIKEYEIMNKEIKELKVLREIEEERKRAAWQNNKERVNYRSKIIFDEMLQNKTNRLQYQKVYENIKNLNDKKDKEYNDFINKAIKLSEDRLTLDEEKAKNNLLKCNERKLIDEENKILAKLCKDMSGNKQICECHRQAFICKSSRKTKQKSDANELLFLKPKNTLLENLRERENASSKNPLQNTHAYFADRVADTLRECRYKNMVLKVLNNYRRDNCLDAKSMPVANF